MQLQVERDAGPVWNFAAQFSARTILQPGHQRLIILRDSDQAGAEGYHELTPEGLPQGKVFWATTLSVGDDPNVTFSHEALEMLADPNVDQVVQHGLRGYALENCDAVEATTYSVNGINVSNFVTPAWFARGTGKLDFLGLCTSPFQILKGGYMSIQEPDGEWTQSLGSIHAAAKFVGEDKWRPQARESGQMRRSLK